MARAGRDVLVSFLVSSVRELDNETNAGIESAIKQLVGDSSEFALADYFDRLNFQQLKQYQKLVCANRFKEFALACIMGLDAVEHILVDN